MEDHFQWQAVKFPAETARRSQLLGATRETPRVFACEEVPIVFFYQTICYERYVVLRAMGAENTLVPTKVQRCKVTMPAA